MTRRNSRRRRRRLRRRIVFVLTFCGLTAAVYALTDAASDRGWQTADDAYSDVDPLVSRAVMMPIGGVMQAPRLGAMNPENRTRVQLEKMRNAERQARLSAAEIKKAIRSASPILRNPQDF